MLDELDYVIPCPHCGEELYLSIYKIKTRYQVSCDSCGASGGFGETRIDAVTTWNNRVEIELDKI